MSIDLTSEQKELIDDIMEGQYEEPQLVTFIEDVLLTKEQNKELLRNDISITDMLNGRFTKSEDQMVFAMFKDWNEKLGNKLFIEFL